MKKGLLCILAFAVAAMVAQSVYGCSCARQTLSEAYEGSELIIVGEFVKTERDYSHVFTVKRSWKSKKQFNSISIFVFDLDGCDNDFNPKAGQEFLLYANSNPHGFFGVKEKMIVFIDCARSPEGEQAKKDIQDMDRVESESNERLTLLRRGW